LLLKMETLNLSVFPLFFMPDLKLLFWLNIIRFWLRQLPVV